MLLGAAIAAGLLYGSAGFAQDPQAPVTDKPKPAARVYGPIGADDQDNNQNPEDQIKPDDRPLTGFQQLSTGTPMERHSYWVPGVSYYNFIESNGSTQGGGNNWSSTSYLAGNLTLLQSWSRSQLALNYSGGGAFSTDSSIGNNWFQQLGLTQTFTWERLQLTFLDAFSYLPQSQFGFGGSTGLGVQGVGGTLGGGTTGLGGQYNPGQSVFSSNGPRYLNAFGTQLTYQLTRRSSVTLGGLYSLLRFTNAGNIENNDYVGNIGYNYQISRSDTIGLVYRYSAIHFIGSPEAIGDQAIQGAYGRKITGRLGLQLTAGAEITELRVPQGPGATTRTVGGTGSATLNYAVKRGTLSVAYFHGLTPGSGVFLGATTDQVTGTVARKISRVWSGSANVGYARNRSLVTDQTSNNNLNYDTVFAGASASRPLGRTSAVSLGYTAYVERAGNGICSGTGCGSTNFTTHQLSVGFSWHTRPFVLH